MFNILKRMIKSGKYTDDYINERIEVFYLVAKISKEEYLELIKMLENK